MAIAQINPQTAHREIHSKLRRAWHKERRFVHLRGACSFLLWCVALVMVDFLIDWLFMMPPYGRVAMLVANVGVLGVVTHRNWISRLHRFDAVRVCLQVERKHPELHNLLVSYVQLDAAHQSAASPALLAAMKQQAVEETRPLNFREIVTYKDLQRLLAVSALCLLLFAAASINWSAHFWTLLQRMVNPTATITYPTKTNIDDITGHVSLKYGQPQRLAAKCSGEVPAQGTLYVRPPNGQWDQVPLVRGEDGQFGYVFDKVFQSFSYFVKVGDAKSPTYEVTVVPPPRIKKARVIPEYPKYTGLKNAPLERLNFPVPQNTALAWELTFDRPLSKAALVRLPSDAPAAATAPSGPAGSPPAPVQAEPVKHPMNISDDGLTATLTFNKSNVGESFLYTFEYTERDYGYEYPEAVRYGVEVMHDSRPEVELVSPAQDLKCTPDKMLALGFRASDNYGLKEAIVVYTLDPLQDERLWKRHKLPTALSGKLAEGLEKLELAKLIKDLKVGDNVTLALEVIDNHEDAAGKSAGLWNRSRTVRLSVLSKEDYLRFIAEENAKLVKEVVDIHSEETKASGEVKGMYDPASQPAP